MDHARHQSVSPPTVSHPSLSHPSLSHPSVSHTSLSHTIMPPSTLSHTITPHSLPRASAPLPSSALCSASAPPAVTAAHRGSYKPAPPALRAVFAARAAGVALTPRDMPPALVVHLHQHWAQVQLALRPVSELHVAAWLKKLSLLVTNPPGPTLRPPSAAPCLMCVRTFRRAHGAPMRGWHGHDNHPATAIPLAHAGPAPTNSAPFCCRLHSVSSKTPQGAALCWPSSRCPRRASRARSVPRPVPRPAFHPVIRLAATPHPESTRL